MFIVGCWVCAMPTVSNLSYEGIRSTRVQEHGPRSQGCRLNRPTDVATTVQLGRPFPPSVQEHGPRSQGCRLNRRRDDGSARAALPAFRGRETGRRRGGPAADRPAVRRLGTGRPRLSGGSAGVTLWSRGPPQASPPGYQASTWTPCSQLRDLRGELSEPKVTGILFRNLRVTGAWAADAALELER